MTPQEIARNLRALADELAPTMTVAYLAQRQALDQEAVKQELAAYARRADQYRADAERWRVDLCRFFGVPDTTAWGDLATIIGARVNSLEKAKAKAEAFADRYRGGYQGGN